MTNYYKQYVSRTSQFDFDLTEKNILRKVKIIKP